MVDHEFIRKIGAVADTAKQVYNTYVRYKGNVSMSSIYRHLGEHNFTRNGKKGKLSQYEIMMADASIGKRPANRDVRRIVSYLSSRDGGYCKRCGCRVALQLDHVNDNRNDSRIGNFQILCANCNAEKNLNNIRIHY